MLKTNYEKNVDEKQLIVTRRFAASKSRVWDAWARPELLEKWWAPKPWRAITKDFDFREGGRWLYSMVGPDGEKSWCIVVFKSISPLESFTALDAFCDGNGIPSTEFPQMHWLIEFEEDGEFTKVKVTVSFDSIEDMNKIVEMGFEEGFAMAHENLDELLEGAGRI